MEFHEVIEISSDSEEELAHMKQSALPPLPEGCLRQQLSHVSQSDHMVEVTSEAQADTGHPNTSIIWSGDKGVNRVRTISPVESPDSVIVKPKPKPKPSERPKRSPRQVELDGYARELFSELNNSVFDNRMAGTELMWNARLCTTAGRAFYHRDKERNIATKIELSPKVVDCKERVRCTLAHEMCHLAVWILDGDPAEKGHGTKFKNWAHLVKKNRPDIEVSTTHSYEIHFKYKWECTRCGKIYGRHSNSIDVEKSACGVCTPPGTLKPLFATRPRRKDISKKQSKFATNSPRDSPRKLQGAAEHIGCVCSETDDHSSDQEICILLQNMTKLSV